MEEASKAVSFPSSLSELYSLYDLFLSYFPSQLHGVVSIALAALLVYAIFQVIKKNFVFLILVVLLLPQAVPILRSIWDSVSGILKFLISR